MTTAWENVEIASRWDEALAPTLAPGPTRVSQLLPPLQPFSKKPGMPVP
jgi:hypothetical protein